MFGRIAVGLVPIVMALGCSDDPLPSTPPESSGLLPKEMSDLPLAFRDLAEPLDMPEVTFVLDPVG